MMKTILHLGVLFLGIIPYQPSYSIQLQEITPLSKTDPLSQDGRYFSAIKFHMENVSEVDEEIGTLVDDKKNITLLDDDGWLSMVVLARLFQEHVENTATQTNGDQPRDWEHLAPVYQVMEKKTIEHYEESFKILIWHSLTQLYQDMIKCDQPSFGYAAQNFENLARYIGPRLLKPYVGENICDFLLDNPSTYDTFLDQVMEILNSNNPSPQVHIKDISSSHDQDAKISIDLDKIEHHLKECGKIALLTNIVQAHHELLWISKEPITYGHFFHLLGDFFEMTAGSRVYPILGQEGLINPDKFGLMDYFLNRLNKISRIKNPYTFTGDLKHIAHVLHDQKGAWRDHLDPMKKISMEMLSDFPDVHARLALK